jgi:hypothetical protein
MNTGWKRVFCLLGILLGNAVIGQAGNPDCTTLENPFQRAGNPQCTAPWARGPNGQRQVGYYVGGGARFRHGSPRYCNEGVWGVDAQPIVPGLHFATVLHWWHGQKYQGGAGSYEPDHKNRPFENHRETRALSRGLSHE